MQFFQKAHIAAATMLTSVAFASEEAEFHFLETGLGHTIEKVGMSADGSRAYGINYSSGFKGWHWSEEDGVTITGDFLPYGARSDGLELSGLGFSSQQAQICIINPDTGVDTVVNLSTSPETGTITVEGQPDFPVSPIISSIAYAMSDNSQYFGYAQDSRPSGEGRLVWTAQWNNDFSEESTTLYDLSLAGDRHNVAFLDTTPDGTISVGSLENMSYAKTQAGLFRINFGAVSKLYAVAPEGKHAVGAGNGDAFKVTFDASGVPGEPELFHEPEPVVAGFEVQSTANDTSENVAIGSHNLGNGFEAVLYMPNGEVLSLTEMAVNQGIDLGGAILMYGENISNDNRTVSGHSIRVPGVEGTVERPWVIKNLQIMPEEPVPNTITAKFGRAADGGLVLSLDGEMNPDMSYIVEASPDAKNWTHHGEMTETEYPINKGSGTPSTQFFRIKTIGLE